ncbi:MAG: hypothetical protein HYU97_04045 [Deltaproteobacteria bacterium]|nr:hypothetical protein [Deltaproteobacteria bacterium]
MKNIQDELERIAKLPNPIQPIELAAMISSHFQKQGVLASVVGGATVQYYTDAEYVTKDLDMVLYFDTKEIVEKTMKGLGFVRSSSYRHFEHPKLPFVVEFPPAPVEIGGRFINSFVTLKMNNHEIRILRVEDIIMDRLIAALVWKDRPSLDQAKLIWIKNQRYIDLDYLKDFAKSEGCSVLLRKVIDEKK